MRRLEGEVSEKQARVGLMAVGLGSYWPQFPQMRVIIDAAHGKLAALIGQHAQVVGAGVVDDAESSRRAGATFAAGDVDLVFVHLATYANSETLLPAIRALDVPVVLLNVQPDRALDMDRTRDIGDWLAAGVTPASLPEMTNVLLRLGKRFDTVTGHLDNDTELAAELELWCGIAALTRRLRTQSLGLLGRPFAGMMDLNVDETHLMAQFGTFVRHLDWDDAVAEMRNVTSDERDAAVAELRRTFPASTSLAAEEFDAAGTVLAAMHHLVARYNLCGIASHYEGASSGDRAALLAALNPALSVLNGRGIACPVEADMKVAFAMLALRTVAGSATLAELYSMDFNDDVIIIGHSGAGDPAISGEPPRLAMSEVFHGKSGKGYLTQFYPRAGDVTLLSVMQDASGGYRMVAAEGEIVPGPTLQLGDTNARVRFPQGLRRFAREWSARGPTHHGVMGYGRQIERLSRVAIALKLPLDVVGS
jgi:L-arabinose isomerase